MNKKMSLVSLIMLLLVVCLCFTALAEEQASTKFEQVLMSKGSLILKEFINIGQFEGIYGEIAILTNVSTGNKTFALRLEAYYYNSQYDNGTATAVMDIEEVSSAIDAVQYMINTVSELTKKSAYTEIIYRSTSDARFGFYISHRETRAFFEVNYKTQKFFDTDKLNNLKDFFVMARDKAIALGAQIN